MTSVILDDTWEAIDTQGKGALPRYKVKAEAPQNRALPDELREELEHISQESEQHVQRLHSETKGGVGLREERLYQLASAE